MKEPSQKFKFSQTNLFAYQKRTPSWAFLLCETTLAWGSTTTKQKRALDFIFLQRTSLGSQLHHNKRDSLQEVQIPSNEPHWGSTTPNKRHPSMGVQISPKKSRLEFVQGVQNLEEPTPRRSTNGNNQVKHNM